MQTCRSACSAAVSLLHLRVCIRAEKECNFQIRFSEQTVGNMEKHSRWHAWSAPMGSTPSGQKPPSVRGSKQLANPVHSRFRFAFGNHVSQTLKLSIIHFGTILFIFTVHNKQTAFSISSNLAWQLHTIGNAQLSVPGSRWRSDQALNCSPAPVFSFGFV